MEMHLVHYKSSYGPDFNTALANHNDTWDTLAVLGVMFRLQSEDNPNLNNIITGDLIILIRSTKKLHSRRSADLHIFKPSSFSFCYLSSIEMHSPFQMILAFLKSF
jgi:carbonic anhydrase